MPKDTITIPKEEYLDTLVKLEIKTAFLETSKKSVDLDKLVYKIKEIYSITRDI